MIVSGKDIRRFIVEAASSIERHYGPSTQLTRHLSCCINVHMTMKQKMNHPVPELPVADVVRAQEYYRDALGFEIGWLEDGKEIGAVSRGGVAIFLRRREPPFEPAVHWVFAEELDSVFEDLSSVGADLDGPPQTKPWGLRQFTLRDPDGNVFYFHSD